MPANICRHIKTNGKRCQSPSLGLSAFCYFHSRLHRRHRNLVENSSALTQSSPNPGPTVSGTPQYLPDYATQHPIEIDLPPVEDAESIQVSISLLIAALARNRIDAKRAAVLLYGLQLASTNAKSIIIEPYASSVIRAVTRTKSGRDLARPDNETPKKTTVRKASEAASPTQDLPAEYAYKENL
jgi:hypothetical protein